MNRRRWALCGGFVTAALALLPPLAWSADQLLSVHIVQHMLLLAVSAPLLAHAIEPVASRRFGRAARVLGHPLTGLLAFNGVLFTWQVPAFLDAAMRQGALHQGAHLSFLLAALCFWWPIVRPLTAPGGLGPIAKIGYLVVAGVPPTIPGVILALSRTPFYNSYSADAHVLGISRIEDQQLAGLVLFGTAKFALLAGTLVILWRLLEPEPERPDDDRGAEPVPATPPWTPAWLERLGDELPAEPRPAQSGGGRRAEAEQSTLVGGTVC